MIESSAGRRIAPLLAAVLAFGALSSPAVAAYRQNSSSKPQFVRRVEMSRVNSGKVSAHRAKAVFSAAAVKYAAQSAIPARGAAAKASKSRQKAVTQDLQALAAESSGQKGPSNEGFRKIVDGQEVKKTDGEAVVAADSVSRETGLDKSVGVRAHEIGRFPGINENLAVNPRELYARAYKEAAEAVARRMAEHYIRVHDPAGQLHGMIAKLSGAEKVDELTSLAKRSMAFSDVSGTLPVRDGRHMNFAFVYPAGNRTASIIYVEFSRGHGTAPGQFNSKVIIWRDASVPQGLPLELADPAYFEKGLIDSPDSALAQAQAAFPKLGSRVSYSLEWAKHPVSGDTDLLYRFYDEKGNEVAVNGAHTGEVRVVKRGAPAEPSLLQRIGRYLGGLGRGSRALAAAAGLTIAGAGRLEAFGGGGEELMLGGRGVDYGEAVIAVILLAAAFSLIVLGIASALNARRPLEDLRKEKSRRS